MIKRIINLISGSQDVLAFAEIQNLYVKKMTNLFLKYLGSNFSLDTNNYHLAAQFVLAPPVSALLRTYSINNKLADDILLEQWNLWNRVQQGPPDQINDLPSDFTFATGDFQTDQNANLRSNISIDGILIDFDFPLVWDHLDISLEPHINVTSSVEKNLILQKLIKAKELIIKTNPVFWDLVKTQTYIIHIRKASDEFKEGSSSNFLRNGATVLRGLEKEKITEIQVAEFLIHEAIHHIIYKYEILEEEIIDLSSGKRPILHGVQSPWSLNYLAIDSYVHACFVWYGVYSFWKQFPKENPQAYLRMLIAESGFLGKRSITDPLFANDIILSVSYSDALFEIEKRVVSPVQSQIKEGFEGSYEL